MQATTLTALRGDMGSANEYHKEEVDQVKNSNAPTSRYYLNEPDAVAEIFDKGNLLRKYIRQDELGLEGKLLAVERALTANLDTKSKNAVKKLQSHQFKKYRARIQAIKKELKSPQASTLSEEHKKKITAEMTALQAEISKVKEPVIGRDFTLTLEKSYSIAFALASTQDKQVWVEVFKDSCRQTLEMIVEEYMRSNHKGCKNQQIKQALEKSVYALYVHFQNRDGDPHLHAHGVVYNLLKELDSERLKGNNFPIMRGENFQNFCKKADLFLHSKMNEGLQKEFKNKYAFTPYKMEKKNKKPLEQSEKNFDLDGWDISFDEPSKKAIKDLSKLSNIITQEVEEKVKEAREERDAEIERLNQIYSNAPDLLASKILEAKARYKNLKKYFEVDWLKKRRNEIKPAKGSVTGSFEDIASSLKLNQGAHLDMGGLEKFSSDFDGIVEKLTENRHNFTELELKIYGLKYGVSLPELKSQIAKILKGGKEKNGEKKYVFNDGQWFSRKNLLMAFEVVKFSQELSSNHWAKTLKPLSPDKEGELLKKFNKDQIEAIKLCLNNRQLNIIAGLPGVGKSTVLKQIVEEYKNQLGRNLEIHTLSTAGKIVEQLAQDIPDGQASTLAAFTHALKEGNINLTKDSVVVLDEAGMVGDRHFHAVFEAVRASGAKIILVGDDRQLSSVERGDSFTEILQQNKTQTVRLNEIVRQKNQTLKSTVELMAGSGVSDEYYKKAVADNSLVRQTLKEFEDKKMVKTFTRSRDLYQDLAASYVNATDPVAQKLVIASSNNEVSKLNNAIQDLLFKDKPEVPFISLEDSDLSFFVGDRVMMTKQVTQKVQVPDQENPGQTKTKSTKVTNGKLGTVLSVNKTKRTMTVEFESDGIKKVEVIDLVKNADSVSLGYASTVHKSQGVSVESVFLALSDNELLNSSNNLNVAISRAKSKCEVYMLGQHKEKIIQSHKENTRLKTLIQNAKQNFFEEEEQRQKDLLAQLPLDIDLDKLSPVVKVELRPPYVPPPKKPIDPEFAKYLERINYFYQIKGQSLSGIADIKELADAIEKRLGKVDGHLFASKLLLISNLNQELFWNKFTPSAVLSGQFSKDSFKISSPVRDRALVRLMDAYKDIEKIPGVSVVKKEVLFEQLEKLVTRPIPEKVQIFERVR